MSFMIVSLFGKQQYLYRIILVCELDSTFLFDRANFVLDGVRRRNGELIAIIYDNRANQAFYKIFYDAS